MFSRHPQQINKATNSHTFVHCSKIGTSITMKCDGRPRHKNSRAKLIICNISEVKTK